MIVHHCKSLFNKLSHKPASKLLARGTFTTTPWSRSSRRAYQAFGLAVVGGGVFVGFGYVVYADSQGEPRKKLVILGKESVSFSKIGIIWKHLDVLAVMFFMEM